MASLRLALRYVKLIWMPDRSMFSGPLYHSIVRMLRWLSLPHTLHRQQVSYRSFFPQDLLCIHGASPALLRVALDNTLRAKRDIQASTAIQQYIRTTSALLFYINTTTSFFLTCILSISLRLQPIFCFIAYFQLHFPNTDHSSNLTT